MPMRASRDRWRANASRRLNERSSSLAPAVGGQQFLEQALTLLGDGVHLLAPIRRPRQRAGRDPHRARLLQATEGRVQRAEGHAVAGLPADRFRQRFFSS